MGLIRAAKSEARAARYIGTSGLSKPAGWLLNMMGGGVTASGQKIDEYTALTMSAVWCAVEAISGDIAKLPIGVYVREGDKRRELPNEPASILLNDEPNPEMIPLTMRQTLTAHALTWGNGIAEIEWANNGRPLAIWPLSPPDVTILRDDRGRIVYDVSGSSRGGRPTRLQSADVFHLHGLGWDGLQGYSVIRMARESMGLTSAAEKFGAQLFGNGGVPSGVLTHPRSLSDQARTRLKNQVMQRIKNRDLLVLEEDLKYQNITISPEDGQFLETRQFQIPEIARWFRMPPHKLMDLLRGTFSNIEHQSIEYVTDCLGAWMLRWEQEIKRKFFGAQDRRYARHNTAALLRGDLKTRYEAHAQAIQWGFINRNEARALEELDGIGKDGDVYLVPANMVAADQVGKTPEPKPAPAPGQTPTTPTPANGGTPPNPPPTSPVNGKQNRAAVRAGMLGMTAVLDDALARCIRTEQDKARRAIARGEKPQQWAAAFYPEHRDHVRGAVFPAAEALAAFAIAAGAGGDAALIAAGLADRHIDRQTSALAGATAGDAEARISGIGTGADDHLRYILGLLKIEESAL